MMVVLVLRALLLIEYPAHITLELVSMRVTMHRGLLIL